MGDRCDCRGVPHYMPRTRPSTAIFLSLTVPDTLLSFLPSLSSLSSSFLSAASNSWSWIAQLMDHISLLKPPSGRL